MKRLNRSLDSSHDGWINNAFTCPVPFPDPLADWILNALPCDEFMARVWNRYRCGERTYHSLVVFLNSAVSGRLRIRSPPEYPDTPILISGGSTVIILCRVDIQGVRFPDMKRIQRELMYNDRFSVHIVKSFYFLPNSEDQTVLMVIGRRVEALRFTSKFIERLLSL
jgi:hypothetical protein